MLHSSNRGHVFHASSLQIAFQARFVKSAESRLTQHKAAWILTRI
jgi:hypothetical protein